jgi:hypothetical protein
MPALTHGPLSHFTHARASDDSEQAIDIHYSGVNRF